MTTEEKNAEKLGAFSYQKGISIDDNPYDKGEQRKLYDTWRDAYQLERSFWEE